jgi:hypothetical protein
MTYEQAGQELVKLKVIEDELVRIHKRMKCVTIGQLSRVLKLSGPALLQDWTDAGREENMKRAKGITDTAEWNKVKLYIKASVLLTYINKQKGEAYGIRDRIFRDKLGSQKGGEGYAYKRPQTARYRKGRHTVTADTPEMRHLPRQHYTLWIDLEKGLEGFKNSGGGESGGKNDAMASGKYLAKKYKSIGFTWKKKDYKHMSKWTK